MKYAVSYIPLLQSHEEASTTIKEVNQGEEPEGFWDIFMVQNFSDLDVPKYGHNTTWNKWYFYFFYKKKGISQ